VCELPQSLLGATVQAGTAPLPPPDPHSPPHRASRGRRGGDPPHAQTYPCKFDSRGKTVRPRIEWPDGKKICATLTVAFERLPRRAFQEGQKGLK